MNNYNQIPNDQALVPHRHNLHTNHLPVLDPFNQEGFDKIIPANEIDSHLHVIGATKSGKTEFTKLVFIRLALKADASTVIFDPHGDLARQCAKMMDGRKDVIYIDPTLKKGLTPTINPFRLKKRDEENISIVAQELVIALESIIGADFSPNMRHILNVVSNSNT